MRAGGEVSNAYSVVELFEQRVAEFAGAPYAVAVESCTAAIFLCCKFLEVDKLSIPIEIPARTYCSVPMAILHAGGRVRFTDREWSGVYALDPLPLYDSAKRFHRSMYTAGFHCLSFHTKKLLNIGRGGMILTDNERAVTWLRRARYDGRDGKPYGQEVIRQLGWNMYLTPEQAARGLMLLDALPEQLPDQQETYGDLRQMPVFQQGAERAA